jgi:NAD+ kinase
MRRIHEIGLIANPEKPQWKEHLTRAVALITGAGRSPFAPQLDAGYEATEGGTQSLPPLIAQIAKTDLILVIGGDGTMLGVARSLMGNSTPILGINTGNLGFLTAAPMPELDSVLQAIWSDDFRIHTRPFIEGVIRKTTGDEHFVALNDFVISRGEVSRMIQLDVSVDGDFLTTYQCDGLIVCSPTGSTAYSLSAGGPIVSPRTPAITLTPICPHALSNRSVIVPLDSVINVDVGSHPQGTILTADGQVPTPLEPGDNVQFQRSQHEFTLLSVSNHSFFQTLRQKMKWSGSNV